MIYKETHMVINDEGNKVSFPYKLRLYGCKDIFELIDTKINHKREIIDQEEYEWTEYSGMWRSYLTGNTLILNQIRNKNEKVEDMDIVINASSNKPYMYLMNELNTNINLTIYWSQIYGTTSDYIIIYDRFGDDTAISTELMFDILNKGCSHKYGYIKNAQMNIITNEMIDNR